MGTLEGKYLQLRQRELVWWHPGKFIGKSGAIVDSGGRDMVLVALNELIQQVTQLLAKTTASKSTGQ